MPRHLHVVDSGAHTTIGGSSSLLMPTGGGGVAAFDPLTLTPYLWLDPADAATVTLNSGNVSQINDKSGNSRHFAQGTAINQPAYSVAGLNGKNCITFGASNYLTWAGAVLPQPLTVVLVLRLGGLAGHPLNMGAGVISPFINAGPLWSMYAGSTSNTAVVPDTSLHMITSVVNGVSSLFFLDGSSTATSPGAGSGAASWEFPRIANTFAAGTITGDLFVFNYALTGTNFTNLRTYIQTKWGTP